MQKIANAVEEIQGLWQGLSMESIYQIQSQLLTLAGDREVLNYLRKRARDLALGLELHRDQNHGFVLLAYSEDQGIYRIPHDHGEAWVIYAMVYGKVEMGNYFKAVQPNGSFQLVLKNREVLGAGDWRIYYPGEIHDTRCTSKTAIILRLTSLDLKEEERQGRMSRY